MKKTTLKTLQRTVLALCSLLPTIIPTSVFGAWDDSGQGEFVFISQYKGTKHLGMGGGGAALANNLDAIFLNPAGLARSSKKNSFKAAYQYNSLQNHLGYFHYGFALDSSRSLALSIGYTDNGTIEEIDENTNATGNVHHPGNMVPALSFASQLGGTLYYGVTAKMITENLAQTSDSRTAMGWGLDGGFIWLPGPRFITLSLSATDWGRKEAAHIENGDNKGSLNSAVRLGLVLRPRPIPRLFIVTDLEYLKYDVPQMYFGGEYFLSNAIHLRGGLRRDFREVKEQLQSTFSSYEKQYQGGHWSIFQAGFSIQLSSFQLDYAIEARQFNIGVNQMVAVEFFL